jgi:hypothetical protein
MTLNEKFHQWLKTEPFSSKERPTLREAQCVVIADENAMEFGKWLNNQVLTPGGTHHHLDGKALITDLYVIYKNQKGL